ncbi:MAG: FtsX-like permease family protein, partial [Bryobacteraceae bacterium]
GLPPQRPINANDTDIEGLVRTEGGPINNVDYWQATGDRYFKTMGIRLMEGRFLDARDGASAPPAVVVNQTFVRHFYRNQDPIGKRVRAGSDAWRTIVGVVEDVKNAGLDQPVGTELYFPFRQIGKMGFGLRGLNVILRTKGDPAALVGAARRVVSEIDPSLPVAHVRTMDDVMLSAQARPRFLASLLTIFSVVALVLAAVGIYGVISYSVARRTAEFGIRMALGARPGDVLLAVLRQGLEMGVTGIVAGFFAALVLTRLIRGLLFGISSFDPMTVALMVLLLLFVTLLACYVPARRATKIDPMLALREE